MWYHRMLSPFIENDNSSVQEVNQSMAGVISRLLTESKHRADGQPYGGTEVHYNLLNLPPRVATRFVKGLSVGLLCVLALLCRTPYGRRDDPRLFAEFSLVVLAMLFMSERSWKHHFVTLLLPYTYLTYQLVVVPMSARARLVVATALGVSALFILTTSKDVGMLFFNEKGHVVAQFFGMFFWAGMVLFLTTAWRLTAQTVPQGQMVELGRGVPRSHLAGRTAAMQSIEP
jgi:hypothetical protein